MKTEYIYLLVGLVLFLLSNFADYQLQAEQHNWNGLMWERYERAEKWPDPWDAIPHDAWHVAQTVRNTCDKIAAVFAFVAVMAFLNDEKRASRNWSIWVQMPIAFIVMFIVYALSRGAAFSLPYRLWN